MPLRVQGTLACDNEGCHSEQQAVIEIATNEFGLLNLVNIRYDKRSGLVWTVKGASAACSTQCAAALVQKPET